MASPRKPRASTKKKTASSPPPADMGSTDEVTEPTRITEPADFAAPSITPSVAASPSGIDTPADVIAPGGDGESPADVASASDRFGARESRVPTHKEIEMRAYYLSRTRPDVDPVALWLLAERQLRDELETRERSDSRVTSDTRPLGEPPSDRRA
jgi:hypothetical protein